jgi:thiamine biosynthesis lipoprotein
MDTLRFRAMNTDVTLAAEGNPLRARQGFAKAQQYIQGAERRFTRFSADSELSQLNRSAGGWFRASADMVFVVMLAQQYAGQTNGLFDPSVLPDLEKAGYDRSMDLIRADGSALPAAEAKPGADRGRLPLEGLIVDPDRNLIHLPDGMRLDLGGIAKGWIAEQAATILAEYSNACLVDAGGDMFMVGTPDGRDSWQIELEDPQNPAWTLTSLDVPPGAVTTSSVNKRRWTQGGVARHHLIDPRSGLPAESGWLSVTVLAPHADLSEVFAKALLIAGPDEAETIARNAPGISYLAVDRAGKIWGSLESLEYINER